MMGSTQDLLYMTWHTGISVAYYYYSIQQHRQIVNIFHYINNTIPARDQRPRQVFSATHYGCSDRLDPCSYLHPEGMILRILSPDVWHNTHSEDLLFWCEL